MYYPTLMYYLCLGAKDEWETAAERRCRLCRWKGDFANWIAIAKAKNALNLIIRHELLYSYHVLIERRIIADVLEIGEDEGPIWVKAASYYVLGVCLGQLYCLLDL